MSVNARRAVRVPRIIQPASPVSCAASQVRACDRPQDSQLAATACEVCKKNHLEREPEAGPADAEPGTRRTAGWSERQAKPTDPEVALDLLGERARFGGIFSSAIGSPRRFGAG